MKVVNTQLFPYLKDFKINEIDPGSMMYKIGAIFEYLDNRIVSGHTLREIINIIDELNLQSSDELFFFPAEDGIRVLYVTGVQTCALPISGVSGVPGATRGRARGGAKRRKRRSRSIMPRSRPQKRRMWPPLSCSQRPIRSPASASPMKDRKSAVYGKSGGPSGRRTTHNRVA